MRAISRIPFLTKPESPNVLIFLHIDLNSEKPTLETLRFFFRNIVSGGIILFDDYGDRAFVKTKLSIDNFLNDKDGSMLKLPTGQAIFFKN